ncbi:hypothetical protein [Enterococcus faecalis]|uniref:hypothetical protein n=1 Tax=Enterococcus faecalis TaxID=1351 RepID=UPI002DBC3F88|nr:hypothetical protein [Enterococcus faecalis]MEB7964819.1 hypothetical protein [Enterococcus faecalis]
MLFTILKSPFKICVYLFKSISKNVSTLLGYMQGLFDDTKVGVQTISELMIALNISKVNELVPKVK